MHLCHPAITGWTVDEVLDCLPRLPAPIRRTLNSLPNVTIERAWAKLVSEEQYAINKAAQATLTKYGEMAA